MLFRTLLIALLALPLAVHAQEPPKKAPDRPVYKLDYTVVELDAGKKTDSHEYSLLCTEDRTGRMRIGTRVPVITGANNSLQYLDVGVNVDVNVREVSDTTISVRTTLEVSSVALPATEAERSKSGSNPMLRQVRGEDDATVTFGKSNLLFLLDEPNSKRSFQISLTATRVH